MRTLQFRIRSLNPGTNLISLLPFLRLLQGIHLIPKPDFGSDLQAEIPDGVSRVAAAMTMIRSAHGTLIEHFTGPANAPAKHRMERTARGVIAA
jgi:pentose-5-phosphate-3-epimerase